MVTPSNIPNASPGDDSGLVIDSELIAYLWNKAKAGEAREKKIAEARGKAIGRELQAEGSVRSDGLGQKMGSVDLRVYLRWQQERPGCWQDKAFVKQFLRDNPQYRAPGYNPVNKGNEL